MADVVAFLSSDWITALDEAAQDDQRLAELTADLDLTVEHVVEAATGPEGEAVRYHVRIGNGTVRVLEGRSPEPPTVRFTQDAATAWEVASGAGSAQRAFMTGRLRVGGDLRVLLDHAEVLAQLHDAFSGVRAVTSAPDPAATGA